MNSSTHLLQQSNLKATNARKVALHFFEKENRPLDADDVLTHLREHDLETDRATVYRILDIFFKKGLINRFEFQEGKFRYELSGRTDHHHLICEKCGKIEDISDCNIGELEKDIKKKKGFLVKRHSLEFYGMCPACNA
jgi:Fur family transcriptional regulator, ferric uptake regulator